MKRLVSVFVAGQAAIAVLMAGVVAQFFTTVPVLLLAIVVAWLAAVETNRWLYGRLTRSARPAQ